MSIHNVIESLVNDKRFNLQIVEHKYIPPVEPLYRKLILNEGRDRYKKSD